MLCFLPPTSSVIVISGAGTLPVRAERAVSPVRRRRQERLLRCVRIDDTSVAGSKNKLTAQILADMETVWTELVTAGKVIAIDSKSTGLSALRTMARTDPSGFIRTYAALLPRAIATDEDGEPVGVIVTGVPRAGRDK